MIVVLAGHHDLARLLDDLLEQAVLLARKQARGVALLRVGVAAAANGPASPSRVAPIFPGCTCSVLTPMAVSPCLIPTARSRPTPRPCKKQTPAARVARRPGESTRASSVSPSQSAAIDTSLCMLPLVAPLFQSSWRLRLQNQVVPVSSVRRNDSAFIHATMSTSPVSCCCTTRGDEAPPVEGKLVDAHAKSNLTGMPWAAMYSLTWRIE